MKKLGLLLMIIVLSMHVFGASLSEKTQGKSNAAVEFIMFTDFEDPFSARWFRDTYPKIYDEYIAEGKLKWVVKHYPLSFHQYAKRAAVGAECAAEQGKFFEFIELLYENQASLTEQDLGNYAEQLGLNMDEYYACDSEDRINEIIDDDFSEGTQMGVRGVPAFFINGELLSGAQPYSNFKTAIDKHLVGNEALCSDSDGGQDTSTKGTATGRFKGYSYDSTVSDECVILSGVSKVKEYWCEEETNDLRLYYYNCPHGCKNGACLSETATQCSDSDGRNFYTSGEVEYTSKDRSDTFEDYCSGSTAYDYFCDADNVYSLDSLRCPYGCDDGACKPKPDVRQCSDTDGGVNYYKQGTAKDGYSIANDRCGVNGVNTAYCDGDNCLLYEGYCDGNIARMKPGITCENGCQNGACINEQPSFCSDTDGGVDLFERGVASGTLRDGSTVSNVADQCVFSAGKYKLKEYWCANDKLNFNYYECSGECKNGVCWDGIELDISNVRYKKPTGPGSDVLYVDITNEGDKSVYLGNYQLIFTGNGASTTINGVSYRLYSLEHTWVASGNTKQVKFRGTMSAPLFDSNKHCGSTITVGIIKNRAKTSEDIVTLEKHKLDCFSDSCTDTDGFNYFKRGVATGSMYNGVHHIKKSESCTIFDDAGQRDVYSCEGDGCRVTEFSCSGGILSVDYNSRCPQGCKNGACLREPVQQCTDSDGGKNIYSAGDARAKDGRGTTDYCDFRTNSKGILHEAICSEGVAKHTTVTCPTNAPYCNRGKCSAAAPVCSDTDGGVEPTIKGTITEPRYAHGPKHTDYCQLMDSKSFVKSCSGSNCGIREYVCYDPYRTTTYRDIACPGGCSDGRCFESSCTICQGGVATGQYDKNGCMIYDCDGTVSETEFSLASGESRTLRSYGFEITLNRLVAMAVDYADRPGETVYTAHVTLRDLASGTSSKFSLKPGERFTFMGDTILFEKVLFGSTDRIRAQFIVGSRAVTGGVTVDIEPVKQEIFYGESAKYKVTITDKHSSDSCDCPEDEVCRCSDNNYAYKISVHNLPFHKQFTSKVVLDAGESETILLTVSPFNVVYESETPEVESEGEDSVAKVTSSSASSGGGGGGGVSYPTGNLYRQYKFSVRAEQISYPSNWVDASAYLILKPKTQPPIFPTDEVSIKLYKGWNLISLPGKLVEFEEGACIANKKLLGFVYIKEDQKYLSLKQAQQKLGSEFSEYLAKNSFWIYSYDECKLGVKVNPSVSYEGIKLFSGWNLIPITEDMVGGYLGDLLNECSIDKLYSWNGKSQMWNAITTNYSFSYSDTSYGFIAKVSDECKLGGVNILPPSMPE